MSFDRATVDAVSAVLVGLLLGLERQRGHDPKEPLVAGIRTFPLLTLAGCLAVHAGGAWLLGAVFAAVAALVLVSYLRTSDRDHGITTEIVALVAPILGALIAGGQPMLAAASAVVIALLLTLKVPLHRIAGSVSEGEILAILKFAVIGVVLVPLLPETPFGPYDAIVPRKVGIVVLVLCGVSLGGYLLVRFFGSRAGWALAGLLGGLASSTAVTLGFSARARQVPSQQPALAVGAVLASTILYLRGLLLFSVFDRDTAWYLAPRLVSLAAIGAVAALVQYRSGGARRGDQELPLGNPVELGRAIGLGLFFSLTLVLARAAQAHFGSRGMFFTGALGGLVDVDSVAIAVAQLRRQGLAGVEATGSAFLLATLSNLALKGGSVLVLGGAGFGRRVLPAFGAMGLATLVMLIVA